MSDAHQSPLISLPLKTTEEVDLGSAVKSLITNSYGEDAKSYAEQTSQLNRARQDAVRGAGSDATGRDLLFKWFHMLEMLELRFPELRVPFPWKDAFTSKQISQSSLAYEKASIIFNIAATLSSLASAQPRMSGNPDGVKRAYTALRQSAGMLSYINENFLHAPSTDMSKDVVKFLVGLVLAQASEVFLEKTIEEKKGNGLISKLASQTAAAYTGLVEDAREFAGKAIFERSWSTLIQTKAKYFTSIMHYYRALADDATGSHGACLVRLTVAETQAKEAQRIVVSFSASAATSSGSERSLPSLPSDAGSAMTALVSAHVARCTERKDVAVKDNDLIYHDILPSESTLPAVDKLVAATPIAIQEIFAAPEVQRVIGPDLFQNLVPLGVHEKASLYSEEKAKIARAESERHDLANGELQASLEYLNLPASLKKYRAIAQGGGGNGSSMLDSLADPGSEVMRWSDEEAEGGGGRGADGLGTGTAGVTSALSRIDSIKSQATAEIESASAALDDENRECEKQRVRFGHKWSQDPAGLHTKEMRQNLKDNREALQQASQNDAQINELWSSIRDDIQLLVSGREALEAAFAAALTGQTGLYGGNAAQTSLIDVSAEEESASAADVAAVKAKVSQIDELLIKLNKIKKERGEVLSDLKEKIQTDDISQVLVLNRRSQNVDASIFNAELEKFKPHQNRIAVSLHHQQALLSELNNAVQELRELPAAKAGGSKWDEKERARNQLVQRLKRARESNAQVRAGVAKGVQFYTDLLEIVKATRQSVNSYCADRKAQRQKLVSELEWDERGSDGAGSAARSPAADGLVSSFASMGIRGGGAGGPPPPPPPHATTQRQASYGSVYSGTAGPTSAPYSSGGPPLPPSVPSSASVSSPYDSMFSTGPFADNRASQSPSSTHHPSYAAPGYPSHHATSPPPLPPHQQPQPQGQRQASGGVGLPPPPQQFHSSFSPSPAQQPASSPTAQSRYASPPPPLPASSNPSLQSFASQNQYASASANYGGYGQQQQQPPASSAYASQSSPYGGYQPPPPPLPQQQQQYSHQQSPYSHPPPPAQYQHQQQHQYSQPPQSPYHSQPPATQGYAPPPPPPQHQPYPQQHQQYASPAPAPQQQHSYQAYRPPY